MSRLLHMVIERPGDCPFRGHFCTCGHPGVEKQWEKDFFGLRCDCGKTGEFPRLCLLKKEGDARVLHMVIEKPTDCPYHGGLDDCDHPDRQVPPEFLGMVCDEEKTGEFPRLCQLKEVKK